MANFFPYNTVILKNHNLPLWNIPAGKDFLFWNIYAQKETSFPTKSLFAQPSSFLIVAAI